MVSDRTIGFLYLTCPVYRFGFTCISIQVKKDAAATEPAWKDAGKSLGLQIWRIVKFKVTHWPKDQYGEFYNGDSYIIMNTYQKPDSEVGTYGSDMRAPRLLLLRVLFLQEFLYDLHFWIGADSTQDEYGTAAYKTVELDTLVRI